MAYEISAICDFLYLNQLIFAWSQLFFDSLERGHSFFIIWAPSIIFIYFLAFFLSTSELLWAGSFAGFITLGRILIGLGAVGMSASVGLHLLYLEIFHQIHVRFSAASGLGPGVDGLLFMIRLEIHTFNGDLWDTLVGGHGCEIRVWDGAHGEVVVKRVVLLDINVYGVDFAVENLLMVLVLDYTTLTWAPCSWHIKEAFECASTVSSPGISLLLPLELVVALGKSTGMDLNTRLQEQWPVLKRPVKPISFTRMQRFAWIQVILAARIPLVSMHGVPDPLDHPGLLAEWIQRRRSFVVIGQVLIRSIRRLLQRSLSRMTHTRIIRLVHGLLLAKHQGGTVLSASGLLLRLLRLAKDGVLSEPRARLLSCAAIPLDKDFLLFQFLHRGPMLVSGMIQGVCGVQFWGCAPRFPGARSLFKGILPSLIGNGGVVAWNLPEIIGLRWQMSSRRFIKQVRDGPLSRIFVLLRNIRFWP